MLSISRYALLPLALLAAFPAQAAVEISAKPTVNMSCSAGVCTPTAPTAVLNVNDLTNMLASGDTTVKSTSQNPDIEIDAALSWTSTSRLTLDSYHAIAFNNPVEVMAAGALTITTNDGGIGGDFGFFKKGHVKFTDTQSSLIINGNPYRLIKSVHDINSDDIGGYLALASNYDAHRRVYLKTPIKEFESVFEGLGNTISNLTVQDRVDGDFVALFGEVIYNGVNLAEIRDLRLTSVNISGTGTQQALGALAGINSSGTLINDFVDGHVTASGAGSFAGGMVGMNIVGPSQYLSANVTVSATGEADIAGGLMGYAEGSCTGRCIGEIDEIYAVGAVTVGANGTVGGLIGQSFGTTIANCYATGSASGGDNSFVGGLIGAAFDDPSELTTPVMTNCYSTGPASGGASATIGGVLGQDEADSRNTSVYWDLDTTGITNPAQGAGNIQNDPGITGLSDAQLKSGLPSGFDPSIWNEKRKHNHGHPYLIDNPPPK